jgi:hypothetical protein
MSFVRSNAARYKQTIGVWRAHAQCDLGQKLPNRLPGFSVRFAR